MDPDSWRGKNAYDFSDSIKNPYPKYLRKPVTIRLGMDMIEYFKELSQETNILYQTLINLYLKDCVQSETEHRMGGLRYNFSGMNTRMHSNIHGQPVSKEVTRPEEWDG